MMQSWQYGADILVSAVFCFVLACLYTLVRKIRGQPWNSAFRKSFRNMGIFFVLTALGILSRMGDRYGVLARPSLRILFVILAAVLWSFPIIWFIVLIRGIRREYDAATSEEFLRLSENKWVVFLMVLAMIFTIIPIFSH